MIFGMLRAVASEARHLTLAVAAELNRESGAGRPPLNSAIALMPTDVRLSGISASVVKLGGWLG